MASPNTSQSFALTLSSIAQSGSGPGMETDNAGSSAQTINAITQAGTASYPLQELLVSSVNAGSTPFQFAEAELISNIFVADAWSTISIETLTDSVLITEALTYEVDIPIESTVTALESLQGTEWTTTISPSSFRATDTISHITSVLLVSTVQAIDSFVELSRDAELSSLVTVTDTIDPGVIYNQLVTETVNAQDVISTGQEEFLVENITATDEVTSVLTATETLLDTATTIDTTTTWSDTYETLSDTVQGSESFDYAGSIYSEIIINTVNAIDSIWAKDFGAIAWTMNSKSGALTNYNNFGFNSMAFHGGKLYATSPEGLFEIGADNDDGRQINSTIKGGFLDFGKEEKKRISDIFVGYTGGDLECDVETYDGPEDVYTYEMEYRDADAPRNSRLKVGRGLSSRYWRLAFRNIGGADFQIHDVAVQMAVSKRRL